MAIPRYAKLRAVNTQLYYFAIKSVNQSIRIFIVAWVVRSPQKQGRSQVSKIGGVHLSFLSLQTFNISSQKASREEKLGWGVPLPSGAPADSMYSLRDFTHLLVHLTAAWKYEIPTSSRCDVPLQLFWVSVPQSEIFGSVRTPTTPTVAAPLHRRGSLVSRKVM